MKNAIWENEIRPKVFTVAVDEHNPIWTSVLGPQGAGHAKIAARIQNLLYPNRRFPILRDLDHLGPTNTSGGSSSITKNLTSSIEYARRWGYSVIVSAPAMTATEQHNMLNEASRNHYHTHIVLIAISDETSRHNTALHQQHGPLGPLRTGWDMTNYLVCVTRLANDPAINRLTIITSSGELLYDSPGWVTDRPIKVNRILKQAASSNPTPAETRNMTLHQALTISPGTPHAAKRPTLHHQTVATRPDQTSAQSPTL